MRCYVMRSIYFVKKYKWKENICIRLCDANLYLNSVDGQTGGKKYIYIKDKINWNYIGVNLVFYKI